MQLYNYSLTDGMSPPAPVGPPPPPGPTLSSATSVPMDEGKDDEPRLPSKRPSKSIPTTPPQYQSIGETRGFSQYLRHPLYGNNSSCVVFYTLTCVL